MFPDLSASNSLADLAHRIRAEHEAAGASFQRGAKHAMAAGDLLIEAKEQVKHGQWLPWLAEHCSISERTAQLYMRLAKARPEVEAKAQRVADLSLRGAIAALAPDDMDRGRELADRVREADRNFVDVIIEKVEDQRKLAEMFFAADHEEQAQILDRISRFKIKRSHLDRWMKADAHTIASECLVLADTM